MSIIATLVREAFHWLEDEGFRYVGEEDRLPSYAISTFERVPSQFWFSGTAGIMQPGRSWAAAIGAFVGYPGANLASAISTRAAARRPFCFQTPATIRDPFGRPLNGTPSSFGHEALP